jgi:molybdopterin-containing oxidoreductase family iron-sulfur binding subunit
MNNGRRKFIKIAGLTAFGIASEQFISTKLQSKAAKLISGSGSTKKSIKSNNRQKVRLAMVVDLRKCVSQNGCTKCIDVCNKEHNIPDFEETKDEIKWIWKEPYEAAFIDQENFYLKEELKNKMVPVFCNNCDNPPCVNVCPTKATFKREDGIVMMDWHRCIGCRYCMAACPYGSRSFNWRDPRPYVKNVSLEFPTRTKGVVEKCEFCAERISKGMLPACVGSCPTKALVFGNLNDPDSEVRKLLKENFSVRRKPGLGTSPEIYYLV